MYSCKMFNLEFSIKSELDKFTKELDDVARTQLPFATSLAINMTAKQIVDAERQGIKDTFPTATPFTKQGVSYIPSNKNKLYAVVFMKDIQAHYLEPYEFGGNQVPAEPSKTAILDPKNIALNTYGNIPYQKIKQLKGRADVFSGTIVLNGGARIGGVFQRMKGKKGGKRLKILVRFSDPLPVHEHLDYFKRATKIAERNFPSNMVAAMTRAIATMR